MLCNENSGKKSELLKLNRNFVIRPSDVTREKNLDIRTFVTAFLNGQKKRKKNLSKKDRLVKLKLMLRLVKKFNIVGA